MPETWMTSIDSMLTKDDMLTKTIQNDAVIEPVND